MNSNPINLNDPIDKLPLEVFSHALSFLPPSSLAHSSAVCTWRQTILSNPILHQVVDLISMKEEEDLLPILSHFSRLSSLSFNRLTKVSLNLFPFYMESALQSMNSSENHSFEPDHTLMDLLSILHKSEDTLKELNLTFDGLRPTDNLWLVPFVLQILSSIRGYRCLRLVSFVDTPIPFSLKCGGNHPDSLKFVLEEKREARFVPSEIVELMMTIEDFVGDGFTEFIPAHRTWYGPEESHPTLEQLKGSTSTLKILDLRQDTFADERGLLTFALQFSKLRYLRLSMMAKDEEEFHDDDDDDEEERPEPEPQVIEVAHDIPVAAELKHLDLVVRDYKVDWSSIVRWAGGGLESLRLGLDLKSSGEGRFHHPSFYGLLVFNSRETIKTLHLHILYEEAVDLQEASEVSLNFPNLKNLSLSNVNESTFEAF